MKEFAGTLLVNEANQVVLQRRTDDAPTSPGMLSMFGGAIELGESPDEAAVRELGEETSLNPSELDISYIGEYTNDLNTKKFYLYTTIIPVQEFAVYEGVGAENYDINKVLARDDLTHSARYTIEKVLGDN